MPDRRGREEEQVGVLAAQRLDPAPGALEEGGAGRRQGRLEDRQAPAAGPHGQRLIRQAGRRQLLGGDRERRVEVGTAGEGRARCLRRVQVEGEDGLLLRPGRGQHLAPGVDDAGAAAVDEAAGLDPHLARCHHPDPVLQGAGRHHVLGLGVGELAGLAAPAHPGRGIDDDLGAAQGQAAGYLGQAAIGADEDAQPPQGRLEHRVVGAAPVPAAVEVPEEALVVAAGQAAVGREEEGGVSHLPLV